MQIDPADRDPLRQLLTKTQVPGSLHAPEQDLVVFTERKLALDPRGAEHPRSVAAIACRTHVEMRTDVAQSARELLTEPLWKVLSCGSSATREASVNTPNKAGCGSNLG